MATRETKDGLGYIIQAISNIVEPKVANLRYDKTYRAKVTEKVDAGIYKVEVNRAEYQLKYNGDLSVGDIVRVKAPLNNFSDIYIEAEPSTGGGSGGTSNYNDLFNKPILNTNNTEAQSVEEEETVKGIVKLHKVSKTGNYNDLNNKPSLDFIPISEKGVANGVATLGTNSKLVSSQLPIASNNVLGAIKVGANLNITSDGTLNVLTSSGTVSDTLPIGSIVEWGSDAAPENWLICNGQELKRNEYPDLFAAIGTTYGEGDGSTTFNLPNMASKFPIGYNSSDSDFNSLGKTGGEKEHTLTLGELPSNPILTTNASSIATDGYIMRGSYTSVSNYNVGGNGEAHNNMPPYLVVNYIIKAKQSAGVLATVVDSLGSSSATDALSANQGKVLNDKIETNTTKLNTIESGAQKNVIELVQRNGVDLPILNKSINVIVPTKTSDLTNDSNYISEIPIASSTKLGGVKIGENLSVTADGVLSATGGGSGAKEVSISETEPTENSIELWVDLSENESSSEKSTDSTPVGALMPYVGGTIPDKWLECDGSSVSSIDYPDLYEAIGNTFGGDSSNFKLPDISGRFLVGIDSSDTDFSTIGKVGGEKTHILTISEMPSHTHKTWISDTAYSEHGDGYQNYYYGQGRYYNNTSSVGGSKAHNNLPPYFTTKYIIKAKK